MNKLSQMQALLPYLAELPHNETVEPFWKAAETGLPLKAFGALLPLFSGEQRHRAYGIASAITGKTVHDLLKQPFSVICRDLMNSMDSDILLFIHIVASCGVRPVCRVLYQYRPQNAMAIPELLLIDRDNTMIAVYACNMLRNIIGMFAENAGSIPTIAELLDPNAKHVRSADANAYVEKMFSTFGRKKEEGNEQQA